MKTETAVGLMEILGKFLLPPAVALLLIAFVYVLWRTGSGHVMRHRLWRFAYGKEAIQDAVVREFMEDRTSLMAFRYTAGIQVRSLERSRRLAEWLKQNDEDIGTIKTAGRYFDLEELKLKDTEKPWPALNAIAALVLVVLILLVGFHSTRWVERGYFTLKESGQWFSATSNDVQSAAINPWAEQASLTVEDCHGKPLPTGGFSAHDAPLLCSLLNDPQIKSYVAKAIREQRTAILSLVTVLSICFVWAAINLRQAACVADLKKRLQRRATQMTFDF